MKKLGLLLFILACLGTNVFAQLSVYNFSQTTTTYTSIASLTPSTAIAVGWDDNASSALNIGFSFVFNGTTYTQFYVNSNGYITFGGTTYGSNYSPISASGYNTVSAIGRDLIDGGWSYGNGLGNNAITYVTTGTTGNHVLTVQWTNAAEYYCCSNTYAATLNFQIKLYESGNKAEVVFGNCTVPAAAGALTPQVGLGYSPSSQYNNRTTPTSWASSVAGTSNSATATLSSSDAPVSGTTYDWQQCNITVTPTNNGPVCQGGNVQLTGTNTNGTSYLWTGPGGYTSTLQNPLLVNATGGVYTLTVTGPSCSNSGTTNVVVNSVPSSFTFSPAAPTVCLGSSVNVTVSAVSSPPPSYSWAPATGLSCTGCSSPNASPAATTIYTVTASTGTCSAISNVTVTVNPVPAAATITPAGPTTFCQGDSVTLNANVVANTTYQWNIYGNPITGANANTYKAKTAGVYTVTLKNTSNCTLTSSSVTVSVNPIPTATASTNGPASFCQGGNVTIFANTGAGLTYQWQLNGTNIGGAVANSYVANASGTYNVVVTGSGCPATSNAVVITQNANPVATVSANGPLSFCSGGTLTLSVTGGAGNTYQWTQNNLNINGATMSTYSPTTSGTYVVTEMNTSGCSATSSQSVVTIHSAPTASFNASGPTTFCQGGSVTLNAYTGAGYTYQWQLNGSDIGGAINDTYSATASGTYNLVTTYDCSVTATPIVVTVNPLPAAVITAAGPTTFCEGASVFLSGNTGAGLTYNWQLNGADVMGATNQSYSAASTGTYNLRVTDANNCSLTSINTVVTVNTPVAASISYTGAVSFCQGGSLLLTANGGGGLTYQWRQNGSNIGGAIAATYTANASGTYDVIVSNGCPATANGVVVNDHVAPTAVITPSGPTSICFGNTVLLNANTGNNLTYQWIENGVNIPGATESSYLADNQSAYKVQVIYDCATTSSAVNTVINPYPDVAITGATGVCQGDSITLAANTDAGNTYQWSLNGTPITGATGSTLLVTDGGLYSLTEINTFNCSYADSDLVQLNPTPIPTITATIDHVLSTNQPYTTYQWIRNGQDILGANIPTFIALQNGTYTVRVTDNNFCTGTSPLYSVNNVSVTNVNNLNAAMSIYPNPNSGVFTLTGDIASSNNKLQIEITDVNGKIVMTSVLDIANNTVNKQISMDSDIPSGMYIMKIKSDEQNIALPFVKK